MYNVSELYVKSDKFKLSKFDNWLNFYVDLLPGVCGGMRLRLASDILLPNLVEHQNHWRKYILKIQILELHPQRF